jgi:hypothetical protein
MTPIPLSAVGNAAGKTGGWLSHPEYSSILGKREHKEED